jgi:uncharacterized membrane protein YjjP (DUF1212 family)
MEANPAGPTAANRDAEAFLLRLARVLHVYGAPVHQVEDALAAAAARLGIRAQFSATPTSIVASIGPEEHEHTRMLRLEPGENDLGHATEVVEVVQAVLRGEMTPAKGTARLIEIELTPPRYGDIVTVLAFALSSASAARFLGGGLTEIGVASAIGLVTGVIAMLARRRPAVGRLFEPLCAFAASGLAVAAAHVIGPVSVYLATLAGIIILIPGLTFTVAVTELSNRHLVAGTARLFGAFTSFIVIAVCVAIGSTAAHAVLGPTAPTAPQPLPEVTLTVALVAAPLAFTVLLRALPRDAIWIMLACGLGFAGTRLGARLLGPELGVFLGALVVGLCGSAYWHLLRRPPTVLRVPGILLLVPGSVGFRSITSLLDAQVVPGVETAFRMITMATALAAGLLVASVVAPTRLGR